MIHTDPYVAEIHAAIQQTIRRRVDKKDAPVDPTRQQQMAFALSEFVSDAIDKYIAGSLQHEDDITTVDLDKEIRNEQLDMFWYNSAKNW